MANSNHTPAHAATESIETDFERQLDDLDDLDDDDCFELLDELDGLDESTNSTNSTNSSVRAASANPPRSTTRPPSSRVVDRPAGPPVQPRVSTLRHPGIQSVEGFWP